MNIENEYYEREIQKRGHDVINIDGKLIMTDESVVKDVLENYDPLPEMRADAIKRVNDQAQAYMATILNQFPAFERDAWPTLRQEAEAWKLDNSVETKFSDEFAGHRRMDRVEFIQRTLAKVEIYNEKAAYAGGTRQRLKDEIRGMKDAQKIMNVNFEPPKNG